MSKKAPTGPSICLACKRPFNPSSPGATSTMGPTCARRSGHHTPGPAQPQLALASHLIPSRSPQGSTQGSLAYFTFEEDLQLSPRLQQLQHRKQDENLRRQSLSSKLSGSKVPKALAEKYLLAKMAFDELMRRFCAEERILYGEPAMERYEELQKRNLETHSLHDPVLTWLEPEYDLHLILDDESGMAYYWRVFNGSYTLLEMDPEESPVAKDHITLILAYTTAHKAYRKREADSQLSFF